MAYCNTCDRYFSHAHALLQHRLNSSNHNYCQNCDRDFNSWEALRSHRIHSSQHHFCTLCDEDFDCEDELDEHMEEDHQYCDPCDLWLDTAVEMQSHDIATHNLCVECDRYFQNLNGLKNHLNSSKHRPKTLRCPGAGCRKSFSSAANMVLHLETDTCVSGITRQVVNRNAARLDRGNLIVNSSRLITGPTETYQATGRAWNGYSYECYLCPKEFGTLAALNQHLASPTHERSIYHCPRLGTGCTLTFVRLGSLLQHIENGSCGVRQIGAVQQGMDRLMQGMRQIAL